MISIRIYSTHICSFLKHGLGVGCLRFQPSHKIIQANCSVYAKKRATHSNSIRVSKLSYNKIVINSVRIAAEWAAIEYDFETTATTTPTKNNYLYIKNNSEYNNDVHTSESERDTCECFYFWNVWAMYFYLFCTISPVEKFISPSVCIE